MSPVADDPDSPPRTLAQAHHVVARFRPHRDAPPSEWLAHHQRAAAWYAEVAEIDRGHHHEALFMAAHQRQLAKDIKTQLLIPQPTGEDDEG